jgi:quercetin dioxygenase-like cupin family protein
MDFPDIITRLPEAELPIPPSKVKTHVLPSDRGQIVFFHVLEDVEIPPHSHKAQWGTVLEGEVEVTIGGEARRYTPGTTYFIPSGVVHSAKARAGAKIMDFFEEPDRYPLR